MKAVLHMRKMGKDPILDDDVVVDGDSVALLLPNGKLFQLFAWGNARGRTGKEAKEVFGQFYRKTR